MIKTKNKISFSRVTWEELYKIDYYREVLEAIEDRESLREAKAKAENFISFREYDTKRRHSKNV
jgi:hypothetical protein